MESQISIKTFAKINLTLDVKGKREDGYHNIDSIFEEISLYDTVTVSRNESGKITVSCNVPEIPCDERNIVYKAASIFFKISEIQNPGIHIHIEKNIPSQAGMGGGSTNAAGVIKILNQIFNTKYTDEQLMKISLPAGADTPFFIKGGIAHITGIGEIIETVNPLSEHIIVVAKGDAGISTPQAYREIDNLTSAPHQNTEKIITAVKNDDIETLMSESLNTFEFTSLPEDIKNIKEIMIKHNTLKALMTGSGAAVFGIFKNKEDAEKAYEELERAFKFATICSNICNQ